MAKVICTLPNASRRINGVTFSPDRNQMVSEDVSDDVAAHFASIKGYKVMKTPAKPLTPSGADKGGKGKDSGGDKDPSVDPPVAPPADGSAS